MLIRDLLVALPGIMAPAGVTRAEDVTFNRVEGQKSSQVANQALTASESLAADPAASAQVLGGALQEFYKTNFQSGKAQQNLLDNVDSLPADMSVGLDSQQAVTVMAGRVANLLPEDHGQIASVRILGAADWGHVSVNPDNSLSLVLSGTDRQGALSFRYEVNYADGRSEDLTAKIKVVPGQQKAGWGVGDHYKLETDADGRSIVEYGDNHREVYVSAGSDALSLSDIARMEGTNVSAINGKWLADNPTYGSSAATALDQTAGMALWSTITGSKAGPSSHWLLLERGHTYDSVKFLVKRGTEGESALNPVLISSYGDGDRPIITEGQNYNTPGNANIVIRDLSFTNGLQVLQGSNYLLEGLGLRHKGLTVKDVDGFTLRNSDIIDVFRTESNSKGIWQPHINRISGVFANHVDRLLIEGNFVDHTGWAENYRANLGLSGGQPPSIYSHNLYLSYGNSDLTLRDNILMRGASFGAQVRSGGVIENNLFLDNNAGVNFLGGEDKKTYGAGNYTLLNGNVITSGGHRDVTQGARGGLSMGADNSGRMTTMIDNIIAHLADPHNPRELAQKFSGHDPLKEKFSAFHNDTMIYNWVGNRNADKADKVDRAITPLDKTILDETTIQKFTAQLLGKQTASIADLANYLRAQADGRLDDNVDADVINTFFRAGFGLETTLRSHPEMLRFTPNALADGIRWDNRMNWSTGDLPHTQNGDSVDLGGNRVMFGGDTVLIDDFIFGDFGHLKATSGRLEIDGNIVTSDIGNLFQTDDAGQIWINGYLDTDTLNVAMTGGRFVNTGAFAGESNITVAENAQLLLASAGGRFDLAKESSLKITGARAKVGFDGTDDKSATLHLHEGSSLIFAADKTGLGKISEVRTGAFGDATKVTSGIRLGGDLSIDLSALNGKSGGTWTLLDADQIIGSFDNITVTGLGAKSDALIQVDYIEDEVVLLVSDGKGSGQVRTADAGNANFIDYTQDAFLKALWANLHATAPQITDDPI